LSGAIVKLVQYYTEMAHCQAGTDGCPANAISGIRSGNAKTPAANNPPKKGLDIHAGTHDNFTFRTFRVRLMPFPS
jgi:hypothetical protein